MAHIIDLTHTLVDGQPVFPGDHEFSVASRVTMDSGDHNLTTLHMSAHHGTHMDAPCHFVKGGPGIDRIPLERLYGPARLIRIPKEPGDAITVDDFMPFEKLFVPGARIIFETGHHGKFGTKEFFDAWPAMDANTAEWIGAKHIGLLGMDMPSPGTDYGPVHRALMGPGADVILVETLANLDKCPDEFTFVGFPLKLKGRDGSPIRAAAIVD